MEHCSALVSSDAIVNYGRCQLGVMLVFIWPHLLLLWTVEGACWVENSLLGVVEQLGDVLQVFGRALGEQRTHVPEKAPRYNNSTKPLLLLIWRRRQYQTYRQRRQWFPFDWFLPTEFYLNGLTLVDCYIMLKWPDSLIDAHKPCHVNCWVILDFVL